LFARVPNYRDGSSKCVIVLNSRIDLELNQDAFDVRDRSYSVEWSAFRIDPPMPRDGARHEPAFLAAVNGKPLAPLGVTRFGRSGDVAAVY
jgi:hypothetical protein